MKTWNYTTNFGWLSSVYWSDVSWRSPRLDRGQGWAVLNTGRLHIGIGWHWPTRVPV